MCIYIHLCSYISVYTLCFADGLDYLFGKSQYSIEPQQRSINITIKIMEDNYLEGTEYFNIRLQNINGAVPEPKILYAQVQIIDDDSE